MYPSQQHFQTPDLNCRILNWGQAISFFKCLQILNEQEEQIWIKYANMLNSPFLGLFPLQKLVVYRPEMYHIVVGCPQRGQGRSRVGTFNAAITQVQSLIFPSVAAYILIVGAQIFPQWAVIEITQEKFGGIGGERFKFLWEVKYCLWCFSNVCLGMNVDHCEK